MKLFRCGDSLKYCIFNFLLVSSLREWNNGAGRNLKEPLYLVWPSGISLSRSKINLPGINTLFLIRTGGFSLLFIYLLQWGKRTYRIITLGREGEKYWTTFEWLTSFMLLQKFLQFLRVQVSICAKWGSCISIKSESGVVCLLSTLESLALS